MKLYQKKGRLGGQRREVGKKTMCLLFKFFLKKILNENKIQIEVKCIMDA